MRLEKNTSKPIISKCSVKWSAKDLGLVKEDLQKLSFEQLKQIIEEKYNIVLNVKDITVEYELA